MDINSIFAVAIFFTLLALSSARNTISELAPLATGEDQICNPSGFMFRYTGIRLYQAVLFDWPVRHYWYLVRCNSGKIASQQFFATNRTSNFQFGHPVLISDDERYILARRKKYALRQAPVFRPLATIGVLYRFNPTTNISSPLSPLYADNTALSFSTTSSFGKRMKYLPVLFTPEEEPHRGWDAKLNCSSPEQYDYSDDDKSTVWYVTNIAINSLNDALTVSSDKFVFWEFDGLQNQLDKGLDWREAANGIIPDA